MKLVAATLALLLSGSVVPPPAAASASLGGLATWYDDGPGYYAAAGPELRLALGDQWRGQTVEVIAESGARTLVTLSDWCACGRRNGVPTLLDLSIQAFADLAPLSAGVIVVDVVLGAGLRPAPTLPPTDTPDQHPEDPPEHPDDDRMREEDGGPKPTVPPTSTEGSTP